MCVRPRNLTGLTPYPRRVTQRILLALALVLAAACLAAAIALPSTDPCRVGDEVILGCPLLTDDRIGLRLIIGAAGVVAGAVILRVRAIQKRRDSLGQQ